MPIRPFQIFVAASSLALTLLVLLSPVMVVAMLAGDRWHARLDQAKFERVVALLLAASGVALLFK